MSVSIWWIRRDLRLTDNFALVSALNYSDEILPVFILDPQLLKSKYVGEKRLDFLFNNLRDLDRNLRQRGSRLILRHGNPLEELVKISTETRTTAVFAEPDYSPYARRRDQAVSNILPVHWCGSPAVHPPGSVLRSDGKPYTVFTPFSRTWKSLPLPDISSFHPTPQRIQTPSQTSSLEILEVAGEKISFPAGEREAQERLQAFVGGNRNPIYQYKEMRNRPDIEGTSVLSPYLRFGILSAQQAAVEAKSAIQNAPDGNSRQSAETWLNELIWRDFYIHILYHFPIVRTQNFRLGKIAWQNNRQDFTTWCEGSTGYPIVDAGMRQLVATGWMHNRVRMITASFLTKDLLVDWRWGERFFMQHLIDGDPAANNGGWQWTAGTGTDAAPYFRIFNPVLQSKKFDLYGNYILEWLPELANVPLEYIHEPWKMPPEIQKSTRCSIGEHYPAPIVDHHWARERALRAFSKAQ